MTDLYRMTWQEKDNEQAPIHTGPILWHKKDNPYWAKEAAPYTHKEALTACKRWNRVCQTTTHSILSVAKTKGETYNGNVSALN